MRAHFQKQAAVVISHRDYTNDDHSIFRYKLIRNLDNLNGAKIDCETFETVVLAILNRHAPLKKKYEGQ